MSISASVIGARGRCLCLAIRISSIGALELVVVRPIYNNLSYGNRAVCFAISDDDPDQFRSQNGLVFRRGDVPALCLVVPEGGDGLGGDGFLGHEIPA